MLTSGQPEPSYRVYMGMLSAEPYPADTRALSEAATLLTTGKTGSLISWARGKDWKRSQAARLVLLGSGDLACLPLLIEGIHPTGTNSFVAFKAVQLHPKEAWPILVRLAEKGNPGAHAAIQCYTERGEPELLRLSKHPNPLARAEALKYVDSRQRLIEALDDPSLAVRRQAVQRLVYIRDFDYKPYLSERQPKVRELFAELVLRWEDHDLTPWLALTSDRSIPMRKWALLHMSIVGLAWGKDSQIPEAIQAVHDALAHGPPELYQYAAMAARGWLVEWYRIREVWTPKHISAAKAVFKLPKFRDAAYYQAVSEGPANGTANVGALGINMRPALHALILSQDRRALPMARKLIDKKPAYHKYWITALSNLRGPTTVDYLFSLIENTADNYAATEVFESTVWALKQMGVENWSRALACLNSSKVSSTLRVSLGYILMTQVGIDAMVESVQKLASSKSITAPQRNHLLFGMQYCPHPSIGDYLERAAHNEPDPGYRKLVAEYFEGWKKRYRKA
jgi:hypothetical protein